MKKPATAVDMLDQAGLASAETAAMLDADWVPSWLRLSWYARWEAL